MTTKQPTPRKFLKRFLWTFAVLLTLTAFFYTIEGWRGARAWAKTEAYLEEEGESLEFSDLRPEAIADADNLCAIPLLASLTDFSLAEGSAEVVYNQPEVREQFLKLALPEAEDGMEMPELPDVGEARAFDLAGWAEFISAAKGSETGPEGTPPAVQIRNAFSSSDADFAEISEAAKSRSGVWIPFHIGDGFADVVATPIPQVQDLMRFSRFLTVKGCAALAEEDTETAIDCLRIQVKLGKAVGAEPLLINHLVEVAMLGHAEAIIREGLLAGVWSAADLESITTVLEGIDLFDSGARAMRGEMTGFFLPCTKFLKSADGPGWGMIAGAVEPGLAERLTTWLIPDGWLDQNASKGCEMIYAYGILPLKTRVLSSLDDAPIVSELESTTPYNFLVKLMVPAMGSVIRKTVQSQVMLDAARIACALERFRIQDGGYPDSLDALQPELLNSIANDPISGKPLLYQRDGNTYRIYSVGIDGKDDGGSVARETDGRLDRDRGDWVWEGGR